MSCAGCAARRAALARIADKTMFIFSTTNEVEKMNKDAEAPRSGLRDDVAAMVARFAAVRRRFGPR